MGVPFLGFRVAYIPNLSLLQSLEPFEKGSKIQCPPVRPTTTPKLHTKPAPPQTHQQPRTPQQTSQFTQGGQERKQQEGADSETFFSSLVDISK